jgi:hypothetical protein
MSFTNKKYTSSQKRLFRQSGGWGLTKNMNLNILMQICTCISKQQSYLGSIARFRMEVYFFFVFLIEEIALVLNPQIFLSFSTIIWRTDGVGMA